MGDSWRTARLQRDLPPPDGAGCFSRTRMELDGAGAGGCSAIGRRDCRPCFHIQGFHKLNGHRKFEVGINEDCLQEGRKRRRDGRRDGVGTAVVPDGRRDEGTAAG